MVGPALMLDTFPSKRLALGQETRVKSDRAGGKGAQEHGRGGGDAGNGADTLEREPVQRSLVRELRIVLVHRHEVEHQKPFDVVARVRPKEACARPQREAAGCGDDNGDGDLARQKHMLGARTAPAIPMSARHAECAREDERCER